MVMQFLNWAYQLISTFISWLSATVIVGGISLLHILIAFIIIGLLIATLVPKP